MSPLTMRTSSPPSCSTDALHAKSIVALARICELVREAFGEQVIQYAKQAAMLDIELLQKHHCAVLQFIVDRFDSEIERREREPNLGVLAAPLLLFTPYGLSGRYALAAPNLEEAVARAASSLGRFSTGDTIQVTVEGGIGKISYRHARRGQRGYTYAAAGTAALLLSLVRSYLGPDFLPHRIELDGPRSSTRKPFEDVFVCPVESSETAISVCLDAALLKRHVAARFTNGGVTIKDVARALFDPLGVGSFLSVVVSHIAAQVQTGNVSIDSTAREMGTSVRTLQRLLRRDSGVDFRGLANIIRLRQAEDRLRGSSASITQVAMELGYSSPANFSRAFRTASGLTPQEYRQNLRAGLPCRLCRNEPKLGMFFGRHP